MLPLELAPEPDRRIHLAVVARTNAHLVQPEELVHLADQPLVVPVHLFVRLTYSVAYVLQVSHHVVL